MPIFSVSKKITVLLIATVISVQAHLDTAAQVQELFRFLRGKRVGVLTNPTGVNEHLQLLIDQMYLDKEIYLKCFFAPEHGLRGDQQAGSAVRDYIDPVTGLPVYSVYGKQLAPSDEQLAQIDVLVYYIQDVGVRFYTYIWSMSYAMEACAKNKKTFVVFDRPNPLNAVDVEGCPNTIDGGLVGRLFPTHAFGLPTRYALTAGELALMLNDYFMPAPRIIPERLVIVRMRGYNRALYFNEFEGLQWVLPSPNMPTAATALVYAGNGIFEGTNASEGRGTTKPFEFIGAQWVDSNVLAAALNDLKLPGTHFRPIFYEPTFSKFEKLQCGGVEVHVLNRTSFQAVHTAAHLLRTIHELYADNLQITSGIDRLFGVANFSKMIQDRELPVDTIFEACEQNLGEYLTARTHYLIYPDITEYLYNSKSAVFL